MILFCCLAFQLHIIHIIFGKIKSMPNIIFKRNDSFFDRLRNYKIFIDDQFIGNLKNNNELIYRTGLKKFYVKAKVDWLYSSSLLIENKGSEDETTILVKNNLFNINFIIIFFVLVILSKSIPSLNLELTLLSVLVGLYPFVKFLLQKQKYLTIQESI